MRAPCTRRPAPTAARTTRRTGVLPINWSAGGSTPPPCAARSRRPPAITPPPADPRVPAPRDCCRKSGTPSGCWRGIPASPRSRRSRWRSASARTARFSALHDAILLRPLPVRDPGAVVTVDRGRPSRPTALQRQHLLSRTTATCGTTSQSFDGLIAYQLSTCQLRPIAPGRSRDADGDAGERQLLRRARHSARVGTPLRAGRGTGARP